MRKLKNLYFFLFILICSCSREVVFIDRGFIYNESCQSPCWNGLIIGVSTMQDVETFVSNLNSTYWSNKKISSNSNSCQVISFSNSQDISTDVVVRLLIHNEKLLFIESTHFGFPNLKEIIHLYGPPDFYKAISISGVEKDLFQYAFYFPKKGFVVETNSIEYKVSKLDDLKIMNIEYFYPGRVRDYYLSKYICEIGEENAISLFLSDSKEKIREWSGLANIVYTNTR